MNVLWHDLECGAYAEDLPIWQALAAEHEGPILDVGAGTGRVTLALAREGHRVTALDRVPELLAALGDRAGGLGVETVVADARAFELGTRFGLCIVPMQTIQLLGGHGGRSAFLGCASRHLRPGAVLAIAISETLEAYELAGGDLAPLPDICELDGVVYSSQPTAIRRDSDGFTLVRRRERITESGERTVAEDAVRLDRLTAPELEREATDAGFVADARARVPETPDYVGSTVVMLRA